MTERSSRKAYTFLSTIGDLDDEELAHLLAALPEDEAQAAQHHWRSWQHRGQRLPPRAWRTWVIQAGRGFGKTRAGAEWVKLAIAHSVKSRRPLRIALVAASIDEARSVMIEGESGLLRVAAPYVKHWVSTGRTLSFVNGSIATLFSGASPEKLRGPEHHIAWCDELAKWSKAEETWNNLQLGMRLDGASGDPSGRGPRVLVTTTPRPGAVLKRIIAEPTTVVSGGHTRANRHLPKLFIEHVEALYGGTRLGKQELEGLMLSDAPGALWSEPLLERCRLSALPDRPRQIDLPSEREGRRGYVKSVIGVDPPTGSGTCGIVACARDEDGHLHVLADHSVTGLAPHGWAQKVAAAAAAHDAAWVVAEDNQGGLMVEQTLRRADRRLRVMAVTARMSKADRATPVATRFEAGKVWLHGRFPQLEAQLCGLIAGGGYEGPGRSPDRADAMVWALSALMADDPAEPRVRGL